jgi:hypothetical protein
MKSISELIAEHQALAEELIPYSFPEAMRLIGATGTMPKLLANTLRIELLAHLAAAQCGGQNVPAASELNGWIGPFLEDSPVARMEDPPEDVFIGCINSDHGSFRVFAGIFADGYFWVERLLHFITEKSEFPGFQEAIDTSLQLLRLSDAVAERLRLARYLAGGGNSAERISEIDATALKTHSDAVSFSHKQLTALGLDRATLGNFAFHEKDRRQLAESRLWNPILERNPLVFTDSEIILALPSSVCRALVPFLIKAITRMGGWADTFYAVESASIFVNDVARRLKIQAAAIVPPKPAEKAPALFPFFGEFDYGKQAILLTYVPELGPAVEDPDGFDRLSEEQRAVFLRYLKECCAALEETPGFTSGLILVAISGAGRGCMFTLPDLGPKWTAHVASINDWLTLADDSACDALRLWRLGQHKELLEKHEIQLFNPWGLLNLYTHWQNSGFSLIPRSLDLKLPHKLLVIAPDIGHGFRVNVKRQKDEHCVRSHQDNRWVRLQRNTRTLNPDHSDTPIYGDIDLAQNGQLLACTERGATLWWVEAPRFVGKGAARDTLFQLWECIVNWVDKSVPAIERTLSGFRPRSILLVLELPDFEKWACHVGNRQPKGSDRLSIGSDPETQTIRLRIPEGFLNEFHQAENVAEQHIVGSVIQGAAHLAGQELSSDILDALVLNTVKAGARYFHFTTVNAVEQIVAEPGRPDPQFVQKEDSALIEIGLADLVGSPAGITKIAGRQEARKFLHDVVAKIWERIEGRLANLDHRAVVSACFAALDELNRDELRWTVSTRALLTLEEDRPFAQSELRSRRGMLSIASLANRLIIETSQYACPAEGGSVISQADHGILLAEFELLLRMAAHCDAVGNGFIDPGVTIHPNGEIDVDMSFYAEVISPYLTKRTDDTIEKADARYEEFFPQGNVSEPVETPGLAQPFERFGKAFTAEFGFHFEILFELADAFEDMAISGGGTCGPIGEREFVELLTTGFHLTRGQAGTILNRFSLPMRSAWNRNLPSGVLESDVFPWRYRRGLSLYARPFVELSTRPKSWMVSASHLRRAVTYLVGNFEQGRFPERYFQSADMKRYIGEIANKKGHEFAEKVSTAMREAGLSAECEIRMTKLGAPPAPDLGDVDVLAWDDGSGKVFIVECKRLVEAVTVAEAVQRLEEFKGDPTEMDQLAKHVRRVKWLQQNPNGVASMTGIPANRVEFLPLLVTSDLVPMQFLKEVKFPAEQFVDFERLGERLAGCGFPASSRAKA